MMDEEWRRTGEILFWGILLMFMAMFLLGTFLVALGDMSLTILGFILYGLSLGSLVTVSFIAALLWEVE